MRRVISLPLAILLVGVCALPAAAQFPGFGIKGGVNLTEFVGGEGDTKTGLNLGASIPLFNLGPVQIVPEIFYAQKGGTEFESGEACLDLRNPSPDPTGFDCIYDFSIDYIEVPLLAKLYLPPIPGARALRPYLQGGPTYAWKLDCELSIEAFAAAGTQERPCESDQFQDARSAIENADRGILLGGGLNLDVPGLGALNLDARWIRGLARLRENSAGEELNNQAFTLLLGYTIGTPGGSGAGGLFSGR